MTQVLHLGIIVDSEGQSNLSCEVFKDSITELKVKVILVPDVVALVENSWIIFVNSRSDNVHIS